MKKILNVHFHDQHTSELFIVIEKVTIFKELLPHNIKYCWNNICTAHYGFKTHYHKYFICPHSNPVAWVKYWSLCFVNEETKLRDIKGLAQCLMVIRLHSEIWQFYF